MQFQYDYFYSLYDYQSIFPPSAITNLSLLIYKIPLVLSGQKSARASVLGVLLHRRGWDAIAAVHGRRRPWVSWMIRPRPRRRRRRVEMERCQRRPVAPCRERRRVERERRQRRPFAVRAWVRPRRERWRVERRPLASARARPREWPRRVLAVGAVGRRHTWCRLPVVRLRRRWRNVRLRRRVVPVVFGRRLRVVVLRLGWRFLMVLVLALHVLTVSSQRRRRASDRSVLRSSHRRGCSICSRRLRL